MSLHHRFVVDTMLGRLARWLRAMGYDTLYPGQIDDRVLLRIAIAEARLLITRDRILARLAGQHGCLIRSERLDAQILEAVEQLSLAIDDARWLSRCLDCNTALDPISKERVAGRVPEHVFTTQTEFSHCPGCGKNFWSGSHSDRMVLTGPSQEVAMDLHVTSRLTRVLDAEGLDALIASTPENLQYVTGFRSIAHALFRGLELYGVFTRQGVGLVVPFIDAAGVAADGIAVDRLACYGKFFFNYAEKPGPVGARVREITRAPAAGPAEALRDVLGGLSALGTRIAVDEAGVFPAAWQRLTEQLGGTTLVPGYAHFRTARMVKSAEEIRRLERAALIAEEGVTAVLGMLKPGVTEREAATVFEGEILRKGAQPFFTVVTMGERAALADVYASERALAAGDLVRFDLGCVYQGYRSDISRTAVLGRPSDKQLRYYNAARDGEMAAIAAMKPGVPVSQIFETAMRVTREGGMPHYERHHVGHGIGLEPYDPPTINAATHLALEPGMVFCVETPYYEHGWGGVQVEDAVEITAGGVRRLTRSSQELAILG